MSLIETCTERLAAAIRTGDVYKRYKKALDELKLMPEEKAKMDELRILNYRMQNEEKDIDLYESIDQVAERMDELLEIPQVREFLLAEQALCRQLQNINVTIQQGIEIDVPDL